MTPAFTDITKARMVIGQQSGGSWLWPGVRGRAAIARNQLVKLRGGRVQ